MKDREHAVDERFSGLFQPDTLLPSQFFDRVRRRSEHEGERRLMIAVLEDAVEDPDRSWLFSFQNICDVLDIDANYLRRGLHAWKERTTRRGHVVTLRTDEGEELRKASGD
jgi:hypothetical protein